MLGQILATKLYIPPPKPKLVHRARLIQWLNAGLHSTARVTLISAPAGYGKTTLAGEWLAGCGQPAAWLSLDEGDNDSTRFLTYLIAALQKITAGDSAAGNFGAQALMALRSMHPPPAEAILTDMINEINALTGKFIFVLEDYHAIDSKAVDNAVAFLIKHLPSQMHLVITTREDPNLPLARLRALGQLTELRAADLRFTPSEAGAFLHQVMDLDLSEDEVVALEARTEGWIAGLQLAALSMRGRSDTHGFLRAFSGNNRYIVEYLVEEVLQRQPEEVRNFLLRTSILDRMSGALCEAVTGQADGSRLLEALERGNLFISPLDDQRQWLRYHHLFADVLHARLLAEQPMQAPILHARASEWYEHNGLEVEAFQHAAAAQDIERAERLIDAKGTPLQFRGAGAPVLKWLASLPKGDLEARPSLWVTYASTLLVGGQPHAVEAKLLAAEAALLAHQQGPEPDDRATDLMGRIASIRATLAVVQHDAETIIAQSRRALEYLHPDNLTTRTATTWSLGYAYQLQGERAAARQAYTEVIAAGQSAGRSIYTIAATINLGQILEADLELFAAARTFEQVLQLAGDPPDSIACEALLGLGRIAYQWNELEAAQQYGQRCLQLTRQIDSVDTVAACGVLLAQVKLAQGDAAAADALLAEAEAFLRQHNFTYRMSVVAAAQVKSQLQRGKFSAAAHLAEAHALPKSQARAALVVGDASSALGFLEPPRQQADARRWADEQLEILILQALAFQALAETGKAVQLLGDALALAVPGGLIRIFVDEGRPMAELLRAAVDLGAAPQDFTRILTAFPGAEAQPALTSQTQSQKSGLIEPLSRRELEILQLIAQGSSNRQISERLFLALNTVKGYNQKIFSKLHVQRRTEAIARARELDLL